MAVSFVCVEGWVGVRSVRAGKWVWGRWPLEEITGWVDARGWQEASTSRGAEGVWMALLGALFSTRRACAAPTQAPAHVTPRPWHPPPDGSPLPHPSLYPHPASRS